MLSRNTGFVQGVAGGVNQTAVADSLGVNDQLVTPLVQARSEGQVDPAGVGVARRIAPRRRTRREIAGGRDERRRRDEARLVGVRRVVEVDELIVADVAGDRGIERGEEDLRGGREGGETLIDRIDDVERKLRQGVQVRRGVRSHRQRRGARGQGRGDDLRRGPVDAEGRFDLRRVSRQRWAIGLADHHDANPLESFGKGERRSEREGAVGVGGGLDVEAAGVATASLRGKGEIAAVVAVELDQDGEAGDGSREARRHLSDERRLIDRGVVVPRDSRVAGRSEIQRRHDGRGEDEVRVDLVEVLVFLDPAGVAVTRGEDTRELAVKTVARGVGHADVEGRVAVGVENGIAVAVEKFISRANNQDITSRGELCLIEVAVIERRREGRRIVADLEAGIVVENDQGLRVRVGVGQLERLRVDRRLRHRLAELNREDSAGVGGIHHLRHDRVVEGERLGRGLKRLAVGGDHAPLNLVGEDAVARDIGL